MQTYLVKCKFNQYPKYKNSFNFTTKNGKPNVIDTIQLLDNMWILLDLNKEEFIMMKKRCDGLGLKIAVNADSLINK